MQRSIRVLSSSGRLGVRSSTFSSSNNVISGRPSIELNRSHFSTTSSLPEEEQPATSGGQLKHSYLKGERADTIDVTLGGWLAAKVRSIPYTNSFRCIQQQITWSYQELKKHSEAFANGLVDIGLRPGDRVGIIAGSTAEQIVSSLAVARIGASLVEFQDIKNEKDFDRYMSLFRPRILLIPDELNKINYYQLLVKVLPEVERAAEGMPIRSKKYPFCKRILVTNPNVPRKTGTYRFRDAMVYGPFGYYENPLRRLALGIEPKTAHLMFLDGKDVQKAKPIVLSQRNVLNAGLEFGRRMGIKVGDRVLVTASQNSCIGAVLGNYAVLTHGGMLVYPSEVYDPVATLQAIDHEKCTAMVGSIQDFEKLINHPDFSKYDHSTMRVVAVEGQPTSVFVEDIKSKLGVTDVISARGDAEFSGLWEINGQLPSNSEVKVVRRDQKIVHCGVPGEFRVRSPYTALGYWNDLGLMQEETDNDGWFRAHKKGTISTEGKINITEELEHEHEVL